MRNAVYLAIVLWFIRRILRKESPAAPGKEPAVARKHHGKFACVSLAEYENITSRYTPEEIEKMLVDGLQQEISSEIDRIIDSKLPSWKEFV